jgi:hypothetical protein
VRAGDYDALLSNETSEVRIHMQKYCKARQFNDRCNLTRAFEDVLQQIIISSRVGAHHAQLKLGRCGIKFLSTQAPHVIPIMK